MKRDRYVLTIDDQATLLRWAAAVIGQDGWVADSEAIGLVDTEDGGRILFVAVLNMWHDQGAWLHLATGPEARGAKMMLAFGCIGNVLAYAFSKGLRRLTARIAVDNVPAQILALKAGFTVEGRERCGFRGRDLAIFAMMRDDCTWLDEGDDMASEEG